MSVRVEVWGDYACFTRPEMKVERVSYDVITPSAARGLIEAIYWHPGLKWQIDRIYVMNPVRFTNIRRNEVKSKISASNIRAAMNGKGRSLFLDASSDIQQRASVVLKDVHYVIEAHFEMTDQANEGDNPGKFQDIVRRRLQRGQCYHQPYFGCREFPASFRSYNDSAIVVSSELKDREIDLGYMLYDMDFCDLDDIQPIFFRGKLKNGVLDLTGVEVVR